jgi:hypothetical protein
VDQDKVTAKLIQVVDEHRINGSGEVFCLMYRALDSILISKLKSR